MPRETTMRHLLGATLVLISLAAVADNSMATLTARYDASIATPQGAGYQQQMRHVVGANFGALLKCFPPRHPTLDLVIFFEISTDGVVGASEGSPQGAASECAVAEIRKMKFPPAPPDFVGKFALLVPGK